MCELLTRKTLELTTSKETKRSGKLGELLPAALS